MNKPNIVTIPSKMERYYGEGTMLHPTIGIISEAILLIPKGQVTTIEYLGHKLAKDFKVNITCPMRIGNSIKKIAKSNQLSDSNIPYWRVLRKDQLMIKTSTLEYDAVKLEKEGFELSFLKSGNIKVLFEKEELFTFE